MELDILGWAVAWTLDKTADAVFAHLKTDPLNKALSNEVYRWERTLSVRGLEPATLFVWNVKETDPVKAPMRNKLSESIREKGHVPGEEMWHAALLESFTSVKENINHNQLQWFFKQDIAQANEQLRQLANRLNVACISSDRHFRVSLFEMVHEITQDLKRTISHETWNTPYDGEDQRAYHFAVVHALRLNDLKMAEEKARMYVKAFPKSVRGNYNLVVSLSKQAKKNPRKHKEKLTEASVILTNLISTTFFKVIKQNNNIGEPVDFVLKDEDIQYVLQKHPALVTTIASYKKEFEPKMQSSGGGHGCFVSNMRVKMKEGNYKTIDLIEEGECVASISDTGEIGYSTVTKVFRTTNSTLTFNGTIILSPSQPVLTLDKTWVEAHAINIGTSLWTRDGKGLCIKSITASSEIVPVFSMEAVPDHNFEIEGIFAHNKLCQRWDPPLW